MYSLLSRPTLRRRLKSFVSPPLVVLAVLVFLLEEFFWGWLGKMTEALGRWEPVARVEAGIRRLPPYPAMFLFVFPWLIILPVKLLALGLVATGDIMGGAALFLVGELVGVGLLHRIYVLCRPALISLAWFIRPEQMVLALRGWVHDRLEQLEAWRAARDVVRRTGAVIRRIFDRPGGLGERLKAARRLVRARFQR